MTHLAALIEDGTLRLALPHHSAVSYVAIQEATQPSQPLWPLRPFLNRTLHPGKLVIGYANSFYITRGTNITQFSHLVKQALHCWGNGDSIRAFETPFLKISVRSQTAWDILRISSYQLCEDILLKRLAYVIAEDLSEICDTGCLGSVPTVAAHFPFVRLSFLLHSNLSQATKQRASTISIILLPLLDAWVRLRPVFTTRGAARRIGHCPPLQLHWIDGSFSTAVALGALTISAVGLAIAALVFLAVELPPSTFTQARLRYRTQAQQNDIIPSDQTGKTEAID